MIFCVNVDTFEMKRINETFNVSSVLFLPLGKMSVDQSYWDKRKKRKIRKLNFVYHELALDSSRVFLHFYKFHHRLQAVGKLGFSIARRIYHKRLTNDS